MLVSLWHGCNPPAVAQGSRQPCLPPASRPACDATALHEAPPSCRPPPRLPGTISRRQREGEPPVNRDYLSSSIRYEEGEQGGKLMDEQGEAAAGALRLLGWTPQA